MDFHQTLIDIIVNKRYSIFTLCKNSQDSLERFSIDEYTNQK